MPAHPPDVDAPDDTLWWRFRGQSRFGHALVALGGFVVWAAAYAYWLDAAGGGLWLVVAESGEAVVLRREAMQVASAACWLWFGLAFTIGRGGPFLNTAVYPLLAIVLGPFAVSLAVAGQFPGSFTGGPPVSGTLILDSIAIFLPGALLGTALVGGFLLVSYFVTGTGPAWEEKHMPEAWHEYKAEVERRHGGGEERP